MDCSKVQEMMSLYIDDQLSKEERKLFEEHIASCEQCKEELDFLQTMINNVNDINEEKELPTDFHKNLMVKIDSTNLTERQTENRINSLNRFRKYYTAVAAVFVIVLVFGFVGITNINRITDDELQYESSKEDSMDKDIKDEATKEAAPVKQIATSDYNDKEGAPKAEIRSKSFKNDPVPKNEIKSEEIATTEDDLGTFEFQAAENGDSISEGAYGSEEKSENPALYKENIEPDNGIQGMTKDDNTGLIDDESNNMDKDNKQLDKGEQIDAEFSESKGNNNPTLTFDSQVDTTTESEPPSNKSNDERNIGWIIIIGITIILIIPLIYIKIEKNKLNR
ncbi:anti-sigma factor family protein [Vallitalea maricola]|uniref:Uncharacterized protein n=1 Tax=Vallitalea maricola TaxID=3074433 RepID=A0ACB5ULN0_9FIRM|nr:hypothetical protein AN2V17_26140 [Vallitalea sp. AN17-2]